MGWGDKIGGQIAGNFEANPVAASVATGFGPMGIAALSAYNMLTGNKTQADTAAKVQKTMFLAPTPVELFAPAGRLVLIRPDGSEGGTHALVAGKIERELA